MGGFSESYRAAETKTFHSSKRDEDLHLRKRGWDGGTMLRRQHAETARGATWEGKVWDGTPDFAHERSACTSNMHGTTLRDLLLLGKWCSVIIMRPLFCLDASPLPSQPAPSWPLLRLLSLCYRLLDDRQTHSGLGFKNSSNSDEDEAGGQDYSDY